MKKYLFILISVLFLSCTAEEDSLSGNLNIPERFWCQDCIGSGSNGYTIVNITRDYITVEDYIGMKLINTSSCDVLEETDIVWNKYIVCNNSNIRLTKRSDTLLGFEYSENNYHVYNFAIYKVE